MSKQTLLKLIREAREMLPHANAEQKIKLITLIKENLNKIKDSSTRNNPDYLPEK